MNIPAKQREFEELKSKVERLEAELQDARAAEPWQPTGFYAVYYATAGALLGVFGAAGALLVNVAGCVATGRHPLEWIRVHLTFPLGAEALRLTDAERNVAVIDDRMILVFGCCLYLATGMLLGIPFHLVISRYAREGSLRSRLAVASALALATWGVAFYGVLSWLQPLLFGGNWLTNPALLPWWVAAGTHVTYGWIMAILHPLGQFEAQPRATEKT